MQYKVKRRATWLSAAELFERLAAVLDGEVTRALEEAARAAERAARAIEDSLNVLLLEATGQDEDAFRAKQMIEFAEAIADGWNDAMLELLRQVQAAELAQFRGGGNATLDTTARAARSAASVDDEILIGALSITSAQAARCTSWTASSRIRARLRSTPAHCVAMAWAYSRVSGRQHRNGDPDLANVQRRDYG